MENNQEIENENNLKNQMILYFSFAIIMIILNYIIQKSNQLYLSPSICQNFGNLEFIQIFYCSTNPYNMPELIGSILAVGITYIIKQVINFIFRPIGK